MCKGHYSSISSSLTGKKKKEAISFETKILRQSVCGSIEKGTANLEGVTPPTL